MREISIIKDELEKLMENILGKITVTRKIAKRNEYMFSVGKTNFEDSEILYEDEAFLIFTEGVDQDLKLKLKKIFN